MSARRSCSTGLSFRRHGLAIDDRAHGIQTRGGNGGEDEHEPPRCLGVAAVELLPFSAGEQLPVGADVPGEGGGLLGCESQAHGRVRGCEGVSKSTTKTPRNAPFSLCFCSTFIFELQNSLTPSHLFSGKDGVSFAVFTEFVAEPLRQLVLQPAEIDATRGIEMKQLFRLPPGGRTVTH